MYNMYGVKFFFNCVWSTVDTEQFTTICWIQETLQFSCVLVSFLFRVCVSSEGEEWQAVRSLLGKHMLRPKAVEAYDKTLNGVVSDLIAKLRLSRRPEGLVTDIASEFYRFGLEGKVLCATMHHHTV